MTRTGGPPIAIVGFLGSESFGMAADSALRAADVVLGAGRLLDALPADLAGKRIEVGGALAETLEMADERRALGERVCLLASGDPGFFGIVRVASARFGPEALEIYPAPSSVAVAFARTGIHWDDATVVSAHGRPLAAAVEAVLVQPKVAVLTAPDQPPEALGRALLDAGCGPRRVTVCARLGHDDEAVTAPTSPVWPPVRSRPCRSWSSRRRERWTPTAPRPSPGGGPTISTTTAPG